ncbi:MAG: hypothetical protein KME40_05240 [Komarekiella atlantica HA4396-MV6]|nr:hypothetical protein [Komarekiella atlantica HA4396-MV6]
MFRVISSSKYEVLKPKFRVQSLKVGVLRTIAFPPDKFYSMTKPKTQMAIARVSVKAGPQVRVNFLSLAV